MIICLNIQIESQKFRDSLCSVLSFSGLDPKEQSCHVTSHRQAEVWSVTCTDSQVTRRERGATRPGERSLPVP